MNDEKIQSEAVEKFRAAESMEELRECYSLVHREYVKMGYVAEGDDVSSWYSVHNALPETTTFVAMPPAGSMRMTVTVIPDSPFGLPMDPAYHDKLAPYRESGKRLAEISMLAFNFDEYAADGRGAGMYRIALLFEMFQFIFSYAREEGIDFLCVKVHPKHSSAYDKLLFEDLGGARENPLVNKAVLIGKIFDVRKTMDFCRSEENTSIFPCSTLFDPLPNEVIPNALSRKYRFTLEDLKFLFAKLKPIFLNLSEKEREYLASQYPEVDFDCLLQA